MLDLLKARLLVALITSYTTACGSCHWRGALCSPFISSDDMDVLVSRVDSQVQRARAWAHGSVFMMSNTRIKRI